jgi:hypothetical protein
MRVRFPQGARKRKKEVREGMALELADLFGGLEEVEVVNATVTEKESQKILVVEVRNKNGEELDNIGFIGEDTIKAALEKGRKENGRIFLKVPARAVTKGERKVNWLVQPY